jgi:hypothetical protein
MDQWPRWSCLMKKTRGRKSGDTVPLIGELGELKDEKNQGPKTLRYCLFKIVLS